MIGFTGTSAYGSPIYSQLLIRPFRDEVFMNDLESLSSRGRTKLRTVLLWIMEMGPISVADLESRLLTGVAQPVNTLLAHRVIVHAPDGFSAVDGKAQEFLADIDRGFESAANNGHKQPRDPRLSDAERLHQVAVDLIADYLAQGAKIDPELAIIWRLHRLIEGVNRTAPEDETPLDRKLSTVGYAVVCNAVQYLASHNPYFARLVHLESDAAALVDLYS